MSESLPHSYIRDEFVVAFIKRRDAAWEFRWKLIADRDGKGREINKAFGVKEPDGSISPYSRSYEPEYKSRFGAMEADFQPRYDAVSTDELAANRADGMTVWEYRKRVADPIWLKDLGSAIGIGLL